MKTKNQSGQDMLDLAVTTAANEDGISPVNACDGATAVRNAAWSPYEVWRTRVKSLSRPHPVDSSSR